MRSFTGQASPLSQASFDGCLAQLGAAKEDLWAVISVETSGCGYLPDRRPKILFERHIFHRLTRGQYDAEDPDVSAPTAGGYGAGGAHQYLRLQAAMQLDEQAALMSASWGLGQILGTNYKMVGYADIDTMVASFVASEDNQLRSMVEFICSSELKAALASRQWDHFARLYNGPNFAKNNYSGKLQQFSGLFKIRGCPDLLTRSLQVLLVFHGYEIGSIDGIIGSRTEAALTQFRSDAGLARDASLQAILTQLIGAV